MKEFFVPEKYDKVILDYVCGHDHCIKTEIYAYIELTGSNATKKVDRLVDLGLVVEKNFGMYNTKRIYITPKGRMILQRMIEMDDIVNDRVPIPEEYV